MKKILILLLLLMCNTAFGLMPEKGVSPTTVGQIKNAENASKLRVWSWVGFVSGNDEFDPLHTTKKRSTFIAHNENTDEKTHFVFIWFHGMGGYKQSSFEGVFGFLKWLTNEKELSYTWIMPELPWSTNVSHIDGRNAWAKQDSFDLFVKEAIAKAPKLAKKKNIKYIIAGHSRGGKAIANAAKTGGLCKVNPHWVIWSDSTYSRWLETAWNYCLKDIPVFMEIFYMAGTETQASVKRFEKINNSKLVEIEGLRSPWYHGKIGNSAIIMSDFLSKLREQ